MRYIIVEMDNAYEKFEIEKKHLVDVKNGRIDMIIDTEESKVFRKETEIFGDNKYDWFDMKPYDKRFED